MQASRSPSSLLTERVRTTVDTARVALVAEHVLLAESLAVALHARGFEVATVQVPSDRTPTPWRAEPILELGPHVALLDLNHGDSDRLLLIEPLQRANCAVVVLTADNEPALWGEALGRGAHSAVSETEGLERLLEALRRAASGEPLLNDMARQELVQLWRRSQLAQEGLQARLDRLTPREGQVLAALAAGKRVGQIARDFFVSEATVRSQVKSILAKLRVNSQIAAVAIARDLGWTPPA